MLVGERWDAEGEGDKYRKVPSVRTERSCKTNQIPILSSGSVSLKALAARLPIRFRVNIPWGAVLLTGTLWMGISEPENWRAPYWLWEVSCCCGGGYSMPCCPN
jgi:hypothetical protein